MDLKKILLIAFIILFRTIICAQQINPLASVIVNSDPNTGNYVASPSIIKLPNGYYIASHDWQKNNFSSIYISKDKGKTWSHLSDVPNMHWGNLFVHNGALYIMGVNKSFENIHICRSVDNGKTWTTPIDSNTGVIFTDGQYHTAPVPVVIYNGRIWRAFEDAIGNPADRNFQALVISANENSDLLNAANWQATNRIAHNKSWGGSEWIEGNMVVTPDNKLVNIMRYYHNSGERAAMIRVNDQTNISFNPNTDFITFPGGSVKFTIRYDETSQKYWSLTNYIPDEYKNSNKTPDGIRNTLALISSGDLIHWTVNKIILQDTDVKYTGFQYADWQFDGDDMITAIRTAYREPDGIKANNFHDANYITFYRIENFRDESCNDKDTILENEDVYLFSYFTNNGEDGLHLAYSYDGLKWKALQNGKSFLQPTIGEDKLMRDPYICQGPDGLFHMVWTPGWNDRIIGYASSKDLVHWSKQTSIPVMMHEPEARNAWAPELFYDSESKLYYIFWATTIPGKHSFVKDSKKEKGYNHRMYYVTTPDFKTFSETKLFFDPGFSVIDASVIQKDHKYILFLKNENPEPAEKNIRYTISSSLTTFPLAVSQPITGDYWAEGPSPIIIGEYVYVYFDKYIKKKYGAVRSLDMENWEDISSSVSFPSGARHGAVFKVGKNVVDIIKMLKSESINLIPEKTDKKGLNYFCTWAYQNHVAKQPETPRDVLSHETLFGDKGWAKTLYPEIRNELIFMLDDGWDLPYDGGEQDPKPYFGGQEIQESKFPGYGDTPQERLKTLVKNIEQNGWQGTGIWICAQENEENRKSHPTESFWRERLEWSKYAGIVYWKIDWGKWSKIQGWRQMISRLAKEIYPELIIEHITGAIPFNDENNTFRCTEEYIANNVFTASYSDVFRTYDVTDQLSVATSLDRIAMQLLDSYTDGEHLGLMNGEDEVYMCATLGLTMGIMRYPIGENEQNSPFLKTRPIRKMLGEVTRALRWSRIAPAFRTDASETKLSGKYLMDDWTFSSDTWYTDVIGKNIKQIAPSSVARGIALPEVVVESGEKPFVVACRNPNGAVAIATFGRTNSKTGYKAIEASVSLNVGELSGKIGVFGYYKELKLIFDRSLAGESVYVQDLLSDTAEDVTSKVVIEKNTIIIPGDLIKKTGINNAVPRDFSEPGLVFQIGL